MPLKAELEAAVSKIFGDVWTERQGDNAPEPEEVGLGNVAVKLDGTVLYADLDGSTAMVDRYYRHFSAEVYKSFLHCTAKIIRAEGGEIVAYDGDRVMAVFLGNSKNTNAVRCALKINWGVANIVNPLLRKQYTQTDFKVKHIVGIDSTDLYVARTGIRGANDLVWVGPAANYAAKLTELDSDFPTWITARVRNNMHNDVVVASDGRPMWEPRTWTSMGGQTIYRSNFWWSIG